VERRLALALPWVGLLLYVAAHPTPLGMGLAGVGTAMTFALVRAAKSAENTPPPGRLALLQLVLQVSALTFLTTRDHGIDPFSYALGLLGVPVASAGSLSWGVGLLGFGLTYLLLVARKIRLLFILG